MKNNFGKKYKYVLYIKNNDKKLYINNIYNDKLVITNNIDEATHFINLMSVVEIQAKINMQFDTVVYIEKMLLEEKYFTIIDGLFVIILKVYHDSGIEITSDFIQEKIINKKYFPKSSIVTECNDEKYDNSNVDAYIIVDSNLEIINHI